MYQLEWRDRGRFAREAAARGEPSRIDRAGVRRVSLLVWSEHCVECAAPDCYSSCALYVARADQKCARFEYGIFPNESFRGLLDYGADVRFRRWGRLETTLPAHAVPVWAHRLVDRIDRTLVAPFSVAAGALARFFPRRRLNAAYNAVRWILLEKLARRMHDFDAFVVECYSPEREPYKLVFEVRSDNELYFRRTFTINPGPNLVVVPWSDVQLPPGRSIRLLVHPDGDAEVRTVFTWLDLVQFAREEVASVAAEAPAEPARHVKCVAWDLDNTVWSGTLVEDGGASLVLRDDVADVMRELDRRGILQTVVSKNDHEAAWAVVERLGLSEYMLYPEVNWEPKSVNLAQIASRLNIGIDTFAFVDDSPFERAEVEQALPAVRVYDADDVRRLLDLPEFDVPITEMSAMRRLTYMANAAREQERERSGGSYEDFLRSCELELRIFEPVEEEQIARCHELIQRSNQLNLSTRRYTREELDEKLDDPATLAVALSCRDRFGDYGLVGFAVVDESGDVPTLRDFVLSCRVAQKRAEHAFFAWLAARERERGATTLRAILVPTPKNGPLAGVFDDLPFTVAARSDGEWTYEADLDELEPDGIVSVRAEVDAVVA